MPPLVTKSEKVIFSSNVTRSLTLVSIKRHHWYSMHAQYAVPISYSTKVIAKVQVDSRLTDRHDKNNICMDLSMQGHKKQHPLLYLTSWSACSMSISWTSYSPPGPPARCPFPGPRTHLLVRLLDVHFLDLVLGVCQVLTILYLHQLSFVLLHELVKL